MSDINMSAARDWADRVIYDVPLGLVSDAQRNAASALLFVMADLEENTLARGRLRLWMEFIYRNCASPDAREYAGEALLGNHVPGGFVLETEDTKPEIAERMREIEKEKGVG